MQEYNQDPVLAGKQSFKLFDTYGFPLEFTEEICGEQGITVDREGYEKARVKHQEASKKGDQSFKGGLADHSEATTALHTATHLLHKSLQEVPRRTCETAWLKHHAGTPALRFFPSAENDSGRDRDSGRNGE